MQYAAALDLSGLDLSGLGTESALVADSSYLFRTTRTWLASAAVLVLALSVPLRVCCSG
jgi:hypothetical protein